MNSSRNSVTLLLRNKLKQLGGDRLINQLSHDLRIEFPEMNGFSISNLKYMKQQVSFYSINHAISQQAVGQITQIP